MARIDRLHFLTSLFNMDVLNEIDRNYYRENEPMTAYQAKFVAEGKPIYYAQYILNKV